MIGPKLINRSTQIRSFKSFSPLSISGLKLWLKSDAGITLVGGQVDVWTDQSGNFNNVSAPAAINRPDYITSIKGKRVLTFNGTNQTLQNLTTELLRNLNGCTIIVAGSCIGTGSPRQQVNVATPGLTGRAILGYRVNSGAKLGATAAGRRNNADALSAEAGKAILNTNWLNNSAVFDWGNAILRTYEDNILTDTLNPFQTSGSTPNDGGGVTIGSNNLLTSGWYSGNIGEVLIFQKILSLDERAKINQYLNNRWK